MIDYSHYHQDGVAWEIRNQNFEKWWNEKFTKSYQGSVRDAIEQAALKKWNPPPDDWFLPAEVRNTLD
jgi:hypothetical protein